MLKIGFIDDSLSVVFSNLVPVLDTLWATSHSIRQTLGAPDCVL